MHMAPPLQALSSILRHVVLAASMLVVMVGAAGPPSSSGSGYSFQLIRQSASANTLDYSDHEYLMKYKLGESLVSGIMDTGSYLTWTNNSQLFDSAVSCPCDTTTAAKSRTDNCQLVESSPCHPAAKDETMYCCRGDCMFKIGYAEGGGSDARGFMVRASLTLEEKKETITMGSAVTFGCNSSPPRDKNCEAYGSGGIVGLGRGKLSLVEQLHLRGFSYCLDKRASSQIVFHLPHQRLPRTEDMKSTALVDVGGQFSHFYYVELKQISMGGIVLDIPEMDKNNGDRGMIIDSGSTYTRLPKEALGKVTKAVNGHMGKDPKPEPANRKWGFSTCYHYDEGPEPPKWMPNMVLQFGGGAQMDLPVRNYMIVDHECKEVCLALMEAHDDERRHTFILGNFQQQNIGMLFDLTDKKLSFMPDQCSSGNMHAAV